MTIAAAILYFFREALVSLRRGWKVSLLAVLTIAVSLFLGGAFLLLTGNLARMVEEWRSEAKVVLYLARDAAPEAVQAVRERVDSAPWAISVEQIDGGAAEERFALAFPDLAELVTGWEEGPLPGSLEVTFDPDAIDEAAMADWLRRLAADPVVTMADDDRRWLRQVETIVVLSRTVGLTFGTIFLVAAIITIGSVIRLTAYLYRDEIAVMRMVGATELIIRGPFVVEGLLQGLAGGLVAVTALFAAFRLVAAQPMPTILGSVFLARFLPAGALVLLVALGAVAGLSAALISLALEREQETALGSPD